MTNHLQHLPRAKGKFLKRKIAQVKAGDGKLRTSLYDKHDFNFHITNFPFLGSIILSSPAYGVFISQLIRYARACSSYDFY